MTSPLMTDTVFDVACLFCILTGFGVLNFRFTQRNLSDYTGTTWFLKMTEIVEKTTEQI